MESIIEPVRITTSLLALVSAAAMFRELKPGGRLLGFAAVWLALAAVAGFIATHVTRGVPSPLWVPLVASLGIGLGIATLFSARVCALFDGLDDRQWRMLMSFRAVFGALLLAASAAGVMPQAFAVPAGLGDLAVGALALAVPGSLSSDGNRGVRLLVFGTGIVDFISVVTLLVTVLVPWLGSTGGIGISLLLPWVAVPLLATLNFHGLRRVLWPA